MPLLQACLNGARRPDEHCSLPTTPQQLARDAAQVMAAGADAVHLHPKDAEGVDTLDGAAVDSAVAAVRSATPGLPLGVTTGSWAEPDPTARVAHIATWSVLPDFASVNWHETGAEQMAGALLERGVGVEAGLWHVEAVERWRASPVADLCFRVLLELPDELVSDATTETAARLLRALGTPGAVSVLLHGEGTSAWPALIEAGRRGLATRIGLEDTLVLPDGSPAPGNAALIRAARGLLVDQASGSPSP